MLGESGVGEILPMDLAAFRVIAFLDPGFHKVITLMVQPFLFKWFKGM
jgi:hypothetical protein